MKDHLLSLHHFFVALILITKGLDKLEHHHNVIGWTILIFGIIALAYFIASKLSKKLSYKLDISIHIFESIALLLTTYVYFHEGKTFLPYVTLIAAVGFLIAAFLHYRKHLLKE